MADDRSHARTPGNRASRSTLQRLAWQLPLCSALALLVALIPAYLHTRAMIERQVWEAIDEEVLGLRFALQQTGVDGLRAVIGERVTSAADPTATYLFVDAQGRRLAGNLDRWPDGVPARNGTRVAMDVDGRRLEGAVFVLPDGARLLVANQSPLRELERTIVLAFSAGALLLVVVTGLVSGFTLMRYRARLSTIGATVDRIIAGDLTQRLLPNDDTELDHLSREFNVVLDAMNRALEAVKHVTAAVAHDMRRPISALRYKLADLEGSPALPAAVKDELAGAIALTDETLASFSALLRLARIEADSYQMAQERVDLEELLRDAVDTYQPVVVDAGRRLRLHAVPAFVVGDRSLLFQVLQNLLDNAINHGAGDIDIALECTATEAHLRVRDHGPGVPEDLLPRLTERFFRVDPSRGGGSSGIGLATVQAIVHAFGGSVSFHNASPGLQVHIRLPCAPGSIGMPAP